MRAAGLPVVAATLVALAGCGGPMGAPDSGSRTDAGLGDGGTDAGTDGGGDAAIDASDVDGGDVDAEPVALGASITLTTDAPGIARGTAPSLTWAIDGDATGLSLFVASIAPGDASAPVGTHWLSPGTLVPTGAVRYLASDGTWSATPVAYATAAAAGAATPTLPSADEGEWLFFAELHDAAGNVVSTSRARVVVTYDPALRLSISRLSAMPSDPIRAELAMSPGATPTDVVVTAWLVAPDGTLTTFPEVAPGTIALYEGTAIAQRIPLFERTFATTGLWRVVARMYDGSGRLLSMAEAGFGVCTDTPTVSGIVRAMDGTPLASTTSVVARVQAIDLADATAHDASLRDDGTFSIVLGPGEYALVARRVDDTGAYVATGPAIDVAGCGAPAPASVTLTAGAPDAVDPALLAALRASAVPLPLGGPGSGGLPPVTIRVVWTAQPEARAVDARQLAQLATYDVDRLGAHALSLSTPDEIAAALRYDAWVNALGGDSSIAIRVGQTSYDYVLAFLFKDAGTTRLLTLALVNPVTRAVFRQVSRVSPTDDTLLLDMTDRLASDLVGPDPVGFVRDLRAALPCPIKPVFGATGPTGALVGGATLPVPVTATLSEPGGRACMGIPITLNLHAPEAASRTFVHMMADTDAMGRAMATFSTTGTPGLGEYSASFETAKFQRSSPSGYYSVVAAQGGATLRANRAALFPSETAGVTLTVVGGDATPRSGAVATLGASLGTLSSPTVTTTTSGAGFMLTAPDTGTGLGRVTASTPAPVVGMPDVTVAMPYVVLGHVQLTPSASSTTVSDGGDVLITGQVLIDGQPARGLTVGLTLAGAGTLSATSAAIGQDGIYVVRYTAPDTGDGTATVTSVVTVDGVATSADVSVAYQMIPFSATRGLWMGRITYDYGGCSGVTVVRADVVSISYEPGRLCSDGVTPCELTVSVPRGASGIGVPERPPLDAPFSISYDFTPRFTTRGTFVQDAQFRLNANWNISYACGPPDAAPTITGVSTAVTDPMFRVW